jgi:hypothetical protein
MGRSSTYGGLQETQYQKLVLVASERTILRAALERRISLNSSGKVDMEQCKGL